MPQLRKEGGRMIATEELRRLLDESGVEWKPGDSRIFRDSITYWIVGKIRWSAIEGNDGLVLNNIELDRLTPEQVIAATLGPGECEMEYVSDFLSWHCKACGHLDMAPRDPRPRYCKWCGRKVVDE